MSAVPSREPASSSFLDLLTRPRPLAWSALAFAVLAVSGVARNGRMLAERLGDTDDATRLVELREFLAGAPWFDMNFARYGTHGVLMHWSRLIDAGLAGLVSLFGLVLPPESAELAARALWPLLVLAPLLVLTARMAERQGGPLGAALALVLAATCLTALVQFSVGRVDHHNVLILCAVGAIWLAPRGIEEPRLALAAGALAGLGLAIGYEALPLMLVAAALVGLGAGLDARLVPAASRFAAGLSAALVLAFIATVPLARFADIRCDALSGNIVAAALCCAAGVAALTLPPVRRTMARRFAVLAATGIVAALVYGGLEPACLAGPFGQVDPRIKPIWLDYVIETRSIVWLFRDSPAVAVSVLLVTLLGCLCQVMLLRRAPRDASVIFATVMLAIAAALAAWQIKEMPYVGWLAVVPTAVVAARLPAWRGISAATLRFGFVVLFNQASLYVATGAFADFVSVKGVDVSQANLAACEDASAVRPLAALAPGLAAAPIDLGPYLVAYTSLRALAAPYHRLGAAIVADADIFGGTPAEAAPLLASLGVAYIVDCPWMSDPSLDAKTNPPGLRVLLRRGEAPPYLEPVPLAGPTGLRVWRVRPEAMTRIDQIGRASCRERV
jgi:hypothetical protein